MVGGMIGRFRMPQSWLGLAALALLAGSLVTSAEGQPYPSKPIKLLVGFAPGSSIDTVGRILAEHLRGKLGKPVTVENRTGANGMLAATELAKSPPDGYTVLISNSSTVTVNPLLYKKMAYDVDRDLVPVNLVVTVPFILTINPDNERTKNVATLADLMKLAKTSPGQLNYGSAGLGNLTQLTFELLNHMAGVKMVHVPYRGSALAQVGVLGKEVDAAFDNPSATPQIKAGRLKAIAVSSAQRWNDLPDVPTIAESGYPGFDIAFWVGAFVPANTPAAVVKTLNEAMASARDVPATRTLLQGQGNIMMLNPEQFGRRIKQETAQYAEIIKRANIQLE
jgi:tripartite-type tricarboxylate transporter receptor subunit TctC